MRLRPALPLTLAVGLVVAVGCQDRVLAPGAALQTRVGGPQAGAAQMAPLSVRTGTVRVDGALLQAWLKPGARQLQTAAGTPVVKVRLTAIGPGIAVAETTEQDFTEAPLVNGVQPPPAALTLAVTPGLNRVFTLEGLDAEGQVVRVMRTLGGVTSGATSTLTINAGTDAAARVLEDLLTPELRDTPDAAGLLPTLGTTDLTADLQAFVLAATGFQAATNTYSKAVAPIHFRDRELARLLLASGRTLLAAAPGAIFNDAAAAGLQLTVLDHGDLAGGATLTLYTPFEPQQVSAAVGTAIFPAVPPGRWVVKAERGGKTAWTTVRTRDSETTQPFFIDLDPQGTGPTPAPPPANLGDVLTPPLTTPLVAATPFPSPASLPYAVTFAGRMPPLNTYNGLGPASDRELSKVDFDGSNEPYILQYGLVLKVLPNHAYEVIAKAGKAPYAGSDLVAMAVAPDGVVYVADNQGTIYKRPLAGAPTVLATVAGTTDLVVHPAGTYVYARSNGAVTKIDPSSANQTFAHGSVPGSGPLTCAGDGVVYAYSDSTNQIWQIGAASPYNAAAFAGSGAVGVADGPAGTASFVKPAGLDLDPNTNTLYVADSGAHRIRAVDGTNGTVSTVAGGTVGHLDVPVATPGALLAAARFNRPTSVVVRTGGAGAVNLMVADAGNARLRTVNVTSEVVSTINAFGQFGALAGQGSFAAFGELAGMGLADPGLLVADDTNNQLWLVEHNRNVSPLVGNGLPVDTAGVAVLAGLQVDLARVATDTTTSTIFLKRNQGSTRVLQARMGVADAFAQSDYAFDGDTAYGLESTGSAFTISQLSLPSTKTALRSNLAGTNANFLEVRAGKAYVAYGGDNPGIEEISLTGTLTRRSLYAGAVHDLCVDPQNGHIYAIAVSRCEVLDIDPGTTPATASVLIGQNGSYAVVDGPKASARFNDLRAIVPYSDGASHYLYVTDGRTVRRIQRP